MGWYLRIAMFFLPDVSNIRHKVEVPLGLIACYQK